MRATNHICKIQMLNHWACPDRVVMISINVYISSNSLRRGDRDGHLGNSRKKKQGDRGYGISRDIEEIASGISRG